MKVKGICKDCEYRWQIGAKDHPRHLYCSHFGTERIVKNLNMQSCKHYRKASEEKLKIIRRKPMKLWIDDIRPAPEGYFWCRSVDEAKIIILSCEADVKYHWKHYGYMSSRMAVELIDIDHDAGDYAIEGGDYIKLLDWFEKTKRNYPIHIHSMNPVGVENMRRIIQKNGWTEIR